MRKLAFVILSSALLSVAAPTFAASDEKNEPPSIIVQGEGKAYAKPTLATIEIGVVSQDATAAQALADNSKAMADLFKTVGAQGIADKDVQTSSFDISPNYINSSNRAPKISGYTVRNEVTVRVHKVDKIGSLLDAVVYSGANQVSRISFSVEDKSRVLDDARRDLIEDARRKATLYAQAAGVELGKVINVIEDLGRPHAMPMAMSMRMAPGGAPPETSIAGGEQELTVNATVVFAIH